VSGSLNGNVVHLNVQYPSPQCTEKPFQFGMYQKPGNCYQYPYFNLYINPSIKSSLVVSKAWCIVSCFDNVMDASQEFTKFAKLLEHHGYPPNFHCNMLRHFLIKDGIGKEDPNYRLVIDYCENIDQNHLARQLPLLDPYRDIQVA
jgi:hypothetical protein